MEELERALIGEQAARAAGERNEARLAVTLSSIGEAVITTDTDGLITMLNPVAQALTGWRESEAIGSHIDTVFETVDEHTRRPNPSPLARVLAADTPTGRRCRPTPSCSAATAGTSRSATAPPRSARPTARCSA